MSSFTSLMSMTISSSSLARSLLAPATCRLRRLLWIDLLSIFVVAYTWRRSAIAATFSRSHTAYKNQYAVRVFGYP